ncbi:Glucosyl-3-phosphoglycerate phosphatase [Pontiella desulfatans]|uniref:Glucosyl-3-phosphoglycerate phosphatase n=1 Tax=Pontiella desulfatans TaxID=2750659 RepID=A0A6C2UAZ2_PONDE|nr:histidine phosphatase family protein [Pontiella desulfatans]VGO17250.1 Glucosyl-3-phosphoglycerate phosphatase [Pontiella desulfatans]
MQKEVLKNRYYAFRHGESLANVEGIIVSDPAVGTLKYGLSETGRRQVRESIGKADEFDDQTLVVSSDFKRTAETAEIVREVLGAAPVVFDTRLRERFFGGWEGASHENYSQAWKKDAYDPDQVFNGAESTRSVRERMWAVVEALEKAHSNRKIILVSHGDPLMLLNTAFEGMDARRHRSLPYFKTAGWRLLNP